MQLSLIYRQTAIDLALYGLIGYVNNKFAKDPAN